MFNPNVLRRRDTAAFYPNTNTVYIGESTYKIFGCTPPYRTQFFRFHIHFHQKAPALEVHAPSKRVHAPLWEILDPPLAYTVETVIQFVGLSCKVM